jgi:hypothetical protein
LIAALLVAIVAGATLLLIADKMPAHMDEHHAIELMDQYLDHHPEMAPAEREAIRQDIIHLRTSKWRLYNAGLGITLVVPILLCAVARFGLWDIRRLRDISTPESRSRLLAIAGIAWIALLPALLLDIEYDYAQDDITPTIDTGHGVFLLVGPPFFAIILAVITTIGRYILLRNARLPANLWIWDKQRPRRNLIWTTFYGFLGCLLFAMIVKAIWDSPWFLPSLIVGLYVIASTRAAVLNGSNETNNGLIDSQRLFRRNEEIS